MYQEAADGSTTDKHQGTAGAAAGAETNAEASLKLAFLCNELLQVNVKPLTNQKDLLC